MAFVNPYSVLAVVSSVMPVEGGTKGYLAVISREIQAQREVVECYEKVTWDVI